jgi:hypothetical protein
MKLLATALLLAAFSPAQPSLSGKWSGFFTVSGNDGHIPQLLVLTQSGTSVTGTGGPDASERYPIAGGKVAGNHVTFDLTNAYAKFSYDLTESGNQLKGKLTIRSINNTRTADVTLNKSN